MAKWADMTPRQRDALVNELVLGNPHECQLVGDGTMGNPFRLDFPFASYRRRSPVDDFWEQWSPNGDEVVINESMPAYTSDPAALERVKREVERRGWDWLVRNMQTDFYAGIWEPPAHRGPMDVGANGSTEGDVFCHAAVKACGWKEDEE